MLHESAPDFSDALFIDHHCHPYEPDKASLDAESLAKEFFHGMGDIPDPTALKARHWGATQDLRYHFPHMGVVNTLVSQLSRFFNCPAELEAVAKERNNRTKQGFAAYAKSLYDDAKIATTVVDTSLPDDDPSLDLIPGKKLRLFKLEPVFQKLLQISDSYSQLENGYLESLDQSVCQKGYVGVKAHLAEQVGFGIQPVWQSEAEAAFPAAKKGSVDARKKLYVAIFTATMRQCQELGVPVHLHSGFTGGLWDGPLCDADPFLLAPLLRQHDFLKTKIVLLHAGYPWTKQAGQFAHTFPHVWVDMGQVTPWSSLRIADCYQDVLAWAPFSKVVVGSGGHGTPEIAWLAAKTAKIALSKVLGEAAQLGFLTIKQAESAGHMILHDNAARLYGLDAQYKKENG